MVRQNDTFPILLLLYFGVFVYRLLQRTVNPPRQVRFLQTPIKYYQSSDDVVTDIVRYSVK